MIGLTLCSGSSIVCESAPGGTPNKNKNTLSDMPKEKVENPWSRPVVFNPGFANSFQVL